MKASAVVGRLTAWAEGDVLTAYQDTGGVWTIGKGHTGPEVRKGLVWTQQQSDEAFANDVAWAERDVSKLLDGRITPQWQFDAMVDMCFNVGTSQFASSTLLKLHLAGSLLAADQFSRWHYDNGVSLKGLRRRCEARRLIYSGVDVELAIKRAEQVK